MKNLWVLCLFWFGTNTVLSQELAYTGQVVEVQTREPVPGAIVMINDSAKARADANGLFVLEGQFNFPTSIKINSFGYQSFYLVVDEWVSPMVFELEKEAQHVDEVLITGHRSLLQGNSAVHITEVQLKELNQLAVGSFGEILNRIPGVYNSSIGLAIGKPVIRGMQGARVVSLLNGQRIENQQWSGDHGIGLTEFGLEKVDLIKGPASLLYGADALGGVLYFSDDDPRKGELQLNYDIQYNTNNQGFVNHFQVKNGSSKIKYSLAGRYANSADYSVPNGSFVRLTRNNDWGVKGGLHWQKTKWIASLRLFASSTTTGIPGHTHDTIVTPETFLSMNQRRSMANPKQINDLLGGVLDQKISLKQGYLKIKTGYQFNRIQEYEGKVTIADLDMRTGTVNASVLWDGRAKMASVWSYTLGYQGQFSRMTNDELAAESYVLDNQTLDNGVFLINYWRFNHWKWQAGVRLDNRQLMFAADQLDFSSVNGAIGLLYEKLKHGVHVNISSGVRMPTIAELTAQGSHSAALRYELGNRTLSPEQGMQVDVVYEYYADHISVNVNPFYSYFVNYIQPTAIDSFVQNVRVYEFRQLSDVQLYGVDLIAHIHPHWAHWLHYQLNSSYVLGQTIDGQNLEFIPVPRLINEVKFDIQKKWRALEIKNFLIQGNYLGRQMHPAELEQGTVDYSLFNVGTNLLFNIKKHQIGVNLTTNNVFNTTYFDNLSRLTRYGIPGPGRSFICKISYQFK